MESAQSNQTYDSIIAEYNEQIGLEGRSLLASMVAQRERRTTE